MVIRGVRKKVRSRDGVGRPDDLPHLQVPPHVWVIEARSDGQHRQHYSRRRQRPLETKISSVIAVARASQDFGAATG